MKYLIICLLCFAAIIAAEKEKRTEQRDQYRSIALRQSALLDSTKVLLDMYVREAHISYEFMKQKGLASEYIFYYNQFGGDQKPKEKFKLCLKQQ